MTQAAIKAALEQEKKDGTAAIELANLTKNKQAKEDEAKAGILKNEPPEGAELFEDEQAGLV